MGPAGTGSADGGVTAGSLLGRLMVSARVACAVRLRRTAHVATAAIVMTAILAGCDTEPTAAEPTEDVTTPTEISPTTPPADDERDSIVAAYERFWTASHQVPHQPESTWDDAMSEVAVDPQLELTLQGMLFQQESGRTSYGEVTSRVSNVEIDGDEAMVIDCQDASKSGQADIETGAKKTVGVERNPVETRMERHDGSWKVAEISYPGGEC